MSTNSDSSAVPPLDTSNPLLYLSSSLSHDLTIASYVLVSALVVQIWDVINNLKADYKLLRKHPLRLPAIVYCISRVSTLLYLLVATIYETAPIGNCKNLSKLPPSIFLVALPATSLLFYFRVSALHGNKYVSVAFFVVWVSILGGRIPLVKSVSGAHIGPTNYCISTSLEDAAAPATIIPLIYDGSIFIAISWRLMRIPLPHDLNFKDALKVIVFGKNLSKISKALLQDGQAYYLSSVGFNLAVVIIFYNRSLPVVYRSLLPLPHFTVMNVMACRVYRRTKPGIYRENSTINPISALDFHKTIESSSKTNCTPLAEIDTRRELNFPGTSRRTTMASSDAMNNSESEKNDTLASVNVSSVV